MTNEEYALRQQLIQLTTDLELSSAALETWKKQASTLTSQMAQFDASERMKEIETKITELEVKHKDITTKLNTQFPPKPTIPEPQKNVDQAQSPGLLTRLFNWIKSVVANFTAEKEPPQPKQSATEIYLDTPDPVKETPKGPEQSPQSMVQRLTQSFQNPAPNRSAAEAYLNDEEDIEQDIEVVQLPTKFAQERLEKAGYGSPKDYKSEIKTGRTPEKNAEQDHDNDNDDTYKPTSPSAGS